MWAARGSVDLQRRCAACGFASCAEHAAEPSCPTTAPLSPGNRRGGGRYGAGWRSVRGHRGCDGALLSTSTNRSARGGRHAAAAARPPPTSVSTGTGGATIPMPISSTWSAGQRKRSWKRKLRHLRHLHLGPLPRRGRRGDLHEDRDHPFHLVDVALHRGVDRAAVEATSGREFQRKALVDLPGLGLEARIAVGPQQYVAYVVRGRVCEITVDCPLFTSKCGELCSWKSLRRCSSASSTRRLFLAAAARR